MTSDRTILITGVTGNQGGAVAQALRGTGFHLRGLTRMPDAERAAALARQGVDVVKGDFDDEATRASAGASGVSGGGTERKTIKLAQGRVARGLQPETENTMSNSISTLLLRNLSDAFGENDPVRRRAAIDEIFHEDAVFYDPKGGVFCGRDEIHRIAGVIKATHPDFEYQPLLPPRGMR